MPSSEHFLQRLLRFYALKYNSLESVKCSKKKLHHFQKNIDFTRFLGEKIKILGFHAWYRAPCCRTCYLKESKSEKEGGKQEEEGWSKEEEKGFKKEETMLRSRHDLLNLVKSILCTRLTQSFLTIYSIQYVFLKVNALYQAGKRTKSRFPA